MKKQLTFLCFSSYFKGEAFLSACKAAGNKVYLVTDSKLRDMPWPYKDLDDVFYLPADESGSWNQDHLANAISYKMRSTKFDRFVALDDFDVERVASLRERFRIPGMGETTSRYFRDKLAMRMKAREEGIPVPDFTAIFNDTEVNEYVDRVPSPWLIKPRSEASAVGIKKIHDKETLWVILNSLGDNRQKYLLEKYSPGVVYHVDSLNHEGKCVFTRVSQYLDAPLDVSHGGGIFRSHTLDFKDEATKALTALNTKVMKAFGMQYSASHTEFIKSHATGEFLFLETSSRVGGANLAEMIEFASGVNLWAEWAKIETAMASGKSYKPPVDTKEHAGIVVSLSRYKEPDTSSFNNEELVWKMKKDWHIGLIIKSKTPAKVLEILADYTDRIREEYHASLPPTEKAP
jgi:D-alanine-D-alanine ligase-like ATP-grasp enzyme